MSNVIGKEQIRRGDTIRFRYHGSERVGRVEVVDAERDYVTIRHPLPSLFDGKVYSTYNFRKMETFPQLIF